jgi:hypothetical protein
MVWHCPGRLIGACLSVRDSVRITHWDTKRQSMGYERSEQLLISVLDATRARPEQLYWSTSQIADAFKRRFRHRGYPTFQMNHYLRQLAFRGLIEELVTTASKRLTRHVQMKDLRYWRLTPEGESLLEGLRLL